MNFLKKIDKYLEDYILAFLLLVIFVVMMAQIVLRTMKLSLSWVEEFSRYLFVVSGFLSIGYTIRKNNILKVDVITSLLPPAIYRVLNVLLMVVSGIFLGYLGVHSVELVRRIKESGQTSAALGFPIYPLYVCALAGLFIGCIRSIQNIILQIKTFRKPESKEETTNLEDVL